jgi:5-methylcytosine-specific restriction endonuclease McrBC regulatory subunit McrC
LYDAKYKPWSAEPSTADLYQIVTYAYRLRLDHATLLYPGHGELAEITAGRYRIAMKGLDVLKRDL